MANPNPNLANPNPNLANLTLTLALALTPTKARFLPELRHVMDSTRKRVIIEMADLTHGVEQPCLMDIKMATRTFTEEDAASQVSKSVSK